MSEQVLELNQHKDQKNREVEELGSLMILLSHCFVNTSEANIEIINFLIE